MKIRESNITYYKVPLNPDFPNIGSQCFASRIMKQGTILCYWLNHSIPIIVPMSIETIHKPMCVLLVAYQNWDQGHNGGFTQKLLSTSSTLQDLITKYYVKNNFWNESPIHVRSLSGQPLLEVI
jgi:hypothetical protein